MTTELKEKVSEKVSELKNRAANFNPGHEEGRVAKAIEEQTAKLPSDTFLWVSVGAMATSLSLKLLKQDHLSLFVGQWVAPFLLFGIYNKLVKLEGHDKQSRNPVGVMG